MHHTVISGAIYPCMHPNHSKTRFDHSVHCTSGSYKVVFGWMYQTRSHETVQDLIWSSVYLSGWNEIVKDELLQMLRMFH
jgi:hypothetical protein